MTKWVLLNFHKPEKIRPTQNHNAMNISDCGVDGIYVPNISNEDNERWECKHIKGKSERVEIRRWMGGVNLIIIVYKSGGINMSMNGKLNTCYQDFLDIGKITDEVIQYLIGD